VQEDTPKLEKEAETILPENKIYNMQEFKALVKERKIGGAGNVFKSMFIPGSGKKVMKEKQEPFTTLGYFLFAGTSIYCRIQSNQMYNKYELETDDLNKRQELYDNANLNNKISIVTGSAAAVI